MPVYGRSNLPKKALLDHPGMQCTAITHALCYQLAPAARRICMQCLMSCSSF
jgi:hypothetical protein